MSGDVAAAAVIDVTSSTCRAGFAGEDEPVSTFPCIVARRRDDPASVYVGDEAVSQRSVDPAVKGKRPVENGVILNWEDMEQIWRHIYDKELGVAAEGRPLLISEASNPKVNREKMTEVMFETFKTPLYIAKRAGLILFASGYTSGFSFHCGSGVSHCVPVYEGHTVPHALKFSFVGGSDVTYQLLKALNERGSSFESLSDVEIVRDIKQKMCYVALDFEQEMQTAVASSSSLEKSYELPDGKVVTVGSERFRCPEVLFQPILLGDDYDHTLSIQQVIHRSVMKYNQDAQSAHIVVSGGSTLLPGLSDRLHKELSALAPPSMRVKLISPPHGSNSAWIGGSMLASLPTFPQMAISTEEYEEFGPAIIHRKCF